MVRIWDLLVGGWGGYGLTCMKKCSPALVMVAILVFGGCGLAWSGRAEEKGPSGGVVDFDALRWRAVLEPSKGGYLAEIFVINGVAGLGGPFVEVRSDGGGKELGLEVVFTHDTNRSWLRFSIKSAPTMSSDLPKELVMRAFFPLPERLAEGDYLLCAPQSEFAGAKPKDFWQARGGLLLRVTKK